MKKILSIKAVSIIDTIFTIIGIVFFAAAVFVWNHHYDEEHGPKDYPHPDTFVLDVSCGEKASVGKATPIRCTLHNVGSGDYKLNGTDTVLFQVYADGKRINSTGAAEGSTGNFGVKHGEQRSEQCPFTPKEPGIHQIRVAAVFTINPIGTPVNPPDLRKPQKYSYQKILAVDAE